VKNLSFKSFCFF